MIDPKKIKLRCKRLLDGNRIHLRQSLCVILDALEKHYSSHNIKFSFSLEENFPNQIVMDEKKFYTLIQYIVEIYFYEIDDTTDLHLEIVKKIIKGEKYLSAVLKGAKQIPQAHFYSKLSDVLEQITEEQVKKNFTFELAQDLVTSMKGKIWIEHIPESSPLIHFILKF